MSTRQSLTTPPDATLASLARRGDRHAFRTLVARHHDAVRRAVWVLGGPPGLIGTVGEVAHGCLVRETISSYAVRPALLLLTRDLHEAPTPGDGLVHGESWSGVPFRDGAGPRHPAVAEAVSRLPASWQAVLWHTRVERDDALAVATTVGVPPGKVGWLGDSALETLRRELLVQHRHGSPPQCLGYGLRLERAGGGVPRTVLRHAHGCPRCARLLDDLAAVDTRLPLVMAEALLGPAGSTYLGEWADVRIDVRAGR